MLFKVSISSRFVTSRCLFKGGGWVGHSRVEPHSQKMLIIQLYTTKIFFFYSKIFIPPGFDPYTTQWILRLVLFHDIHYQLTNLNFFYVRQYILILRVSTKKKRNFLIQKSSKNYIIELFFFSKHLQFFFSKWVLSFYWSSRKISLIDLIKL